MKSIFKFASALAFVLAAGAVLASCEKPAGPDEVPGPMEYPANPMTFTVDGTETPVGKAFADAFEEYVLITVTPDTEVESYVDAVTADGVEYLQFMVLPQNLNREIDLVAEPQRIYCKDNESDCTVISPDGNLTEGKAVVQYDEETSEVVFKLAIELSDGTVVGVNAGALMSAPAPEQGGTITVDGTQEPVRGAFYLEDSGNTALYFTSSEVYTFEELQEMALYYFLIMVPDGLMTGEDFDMADLSGEDNVVVMYIDYANGGQYEANSGDGGASLTFNMQKTSDGTYAASISAAFDGGPEIAVDFDGTCVSVDYVPEEPNEFTYEGTTEAVQSALVDKSDPDIWHVWLSAVGGLEDLSEYEDPYNEAIHITAPAEAFNAGGVGFSTYKEILKFEYAGQTWQYTEDNSVRGTLEVSLEGDMLTVDFTNYDNFKGHYSGTAVIVE